MGKPLFYRLFGVGKLPPQRVAALKQEGILLLEEGVGGSVTFRNFRTPGKSFLWKRQWYTASLALTELRLVGFRYSDLILDVPFTDERLRRMKFSVEKDAVLLVAFDAGLFQESWSGTLEYRFRTPLAHDFLKILRERAG